MKTLLITACLLIGSSLYMQAQIISVTETSYRSATARNPETALIVDINSNLKITVNKDALLGKLAASQKGDNEQLKKLNALIYVLQTEREILQLLKPAIENADPDLTELRKYSQLMIAFYDKVVANPELREQVNILYREAISKARDKTLDLTVYPTLQSYVMKKLIASLDDIREQVRTSYNVNSQNIQVVAFLSTESESNRKVHIENFDNYSAGNFYEVPRWVTSFSEDDLKKFDEVAKLSTYLNREIDNHFEGLKKLVPDSFKSDECLIKLKETITAEINRLSADGNEIKAYLEKVEGYLKNILAIIDELKKLKDPKTALSKFKQLQPQLIAAAKEFPILVNAAKSQLSDQLKKGEKSIAAIEAQLISCNEALTQDLSLLANIYNVITNLLSPFKDSAETASLIQGDAFSFTLDKLPSEGYIELKTTGKRKNRDKLLLKIITRTSEDVEKNLPGQTIYRAEIELQQIAVYTESNISVVLASPLSKSAAVTLTNTFQFAPSGNLVAKVGSRNKPWVNTVNPGIGVGISTPDFNLDGSPDISYGGVLTLFRNVASVGLSYNTKTNSSFWFFGFSLPFSSFGLPIGAVQNQKGN